MRNMALFERKVVSMDTGNIVAEAVKRDSYGAILNAPAWVSALLVDAERAEGKARHDSS